MDTDYPAAHSMDTVWFAVDAVGQVGLFDSGETGHVPDGEENDVRTELWDLWRPGEEKDDYWDLDYLCAIKGIYYFLYPETYGFGPVGLYRRDLVPKRPLHVDQLPYELRLRCRDPLFSFRFDQVKQFQPLEHVRCVLWDSSIAAYLCGDGKTVKPLPGQEAKFAEFVREFRKEEPEQASQLRFEGPLEDGQEKE
jgi:hypothetical protein